MVVACGTCSGAAGAVAGVSERLYGSRSGRSRCRCSVNDDVALPATWFAVDSCTRALLERGPSTSVQLPAGAATAPLGSGLLAALLDEGADEFLGVGLKDAVDFVQQV